MVDIHRMVVETALVYILWVVVSDLPRNQGRKESSQCSEDSLRLPELRTQVGEPISQ